MNTTRHALVALGADPDETTAELAARESQGARNASPLADMTAAEYAREERGE